MYGRSLIGSRSPIGRDDSVNEDVNPIHNGTNEEEGRERKREREKSLSTKPERSATDGDVFQSVQNDDSLRKKNEKKKKEKKWRQKWRRQTHGNTLDTRELEIRKKWMTGRLPNAIVANGHPTVRTSRG